jgi:hypothetical protein
MKCEHDCDCWCSLLEYVEFKPIKNPRPFPPLKQIIMTGGQISTSDKNPSKRYFMNASEYLKEDPRKTGLKNGLRQLTVEQLQRVINYPGEMVLDSCNYEDGKFCALAIGVGLDLIMDNPTHDKVFDILTNMGYNVYNTRGIPGEFYTTNRLEDLLTAAKEVLEEKLGSDLNKSDP